MKKRVILFGLVLFVFLVFPTLATKVIKDDEEATHIFIGEVEEVQGYFDLNEWDDYLIFSRIKVKVKKELKGKAEKDVSFSVEGGTIGEIGLWVSESPAFKKGEAYKFYLKKTDSEYKLLKQERVMTPNQTTCCATFARWFGNSALYSINPDNNDMATSCALTEIQAGAGAWNPPFNLQFESLTTENKVRQNFRNVVFFRKVKSRSTIAVTYIWYYASTGQILEFDMVFYDGWKFFSTGNGCTNTCNGGFYLSVIAVHEFGHAIGLDHNDCQDSIMYPYASYCDTGWITRDDKTCADSIY